MIGFSLQKNRLALALLLALACPLHAKTLNNAADKPAAPTTQPKPRRYKIGDAPEDKMNTPVERFLMTVGTLGLIYFWPGAKFQLKSDNTNIELNGPRR
jgi:hypothetical protein